MTNGLNNLFNRFKESIKNDDKNIFETIEKFYNIVIKNNSLGIKDEIKMFEKTFYVSSGNMYEIKIYKEYKWKLIQSNLVIKMNEYMGYDITIYTKKDKVVFADCLRNDLKNININDIFTESLQIDNEIKTVYNLIDNFILKNHENFSYTKFKKLVSKLKIYRNRYDIKRIIYDRNYEHCVCINWINNEVEFESYNNGDGFKVKITHQLLYPINDGNLSSDDEENRKYCNVCDMYIKNYYQKHVITQEHINKEIINK